MKKTVSIIVAFFLSVFASYSQKTGTYSGKITLFEDIPLIKLYPALEYEPGKEIVDISYQYYVNSKGERVRQGRCKINMDGDGLFDKIAIEGNYSNDKIDGKWIFARTSGISDESYYAIINYNNGEIEGPVKLHIMLDMFYVPIIEGYFNKGVPVNLQIQWPSSHKIGMSGSFRFDEFGLLDGDCNGWMCDYIPKPFKLEYSHGRLIRSEVYDDSTGKTSVDEPITIDFLPMKELKLEDGTVFYIDEENDIYEEEMKTCGAIKDDFNLYVLNALEAIGFDSKKIKGPEFIEYVPAEEHYKEAKLRILTKERKDFERARDSVITDVRNMKDSIDNLLQVYNVENGYAKMVKYSLFCFFEESGASALTDSLSTLASRRYLRTETLDDIASSRAVLKEMTTITAELEKELADIAAAKSIMINSKLKRKEKRQLNGLLKKRDYWGVCEFWRNIESKNNK